MITLVQLKMKSLLLSENFLLASENMRETESLASGVMFSKLDRSHSFWCAKLTLLVDRYDWQITRCKSQFVTTFRRKVLKN